jgi:hypothetical protein
MLNDKCVSMSACTGLRTEYFLKVWNDAMVWFRPSAGQREGAVHCVWTVYPVVLGNRDGPLLGKSLIDWLILV